ncbi:hypothetical protein BH09PSE2_BH09PSE2_13030 [soil metagenome]
MDKRIIVGACASFAALAGGAAFAQAPAAAPAAAKPSQEYSTAAATVEVAKPVAEVMKKVGGYCDIGAWLKTTCVQTGPAEQMGAVRVIAGRVTEILVAKTATSYTYAQPLAPNSYHGTIEFQPAGAGTRIVYTLFFDLAVNADQAAKDKDLATRKATVKRFVDAMKTAAEG